MAAHQAPLSLGFSRQEHWSGLPFPSPMHETEKWKGSRLVVSDSSWPHGLQPTRLLHPWDWKFLQFIPWRGTPEKLCILFWSNDEVEVTLNFFWAMPPDACSLHPYLLGFSQFRNKPSLLSLGLRQHNEIATLNVWPGPCGTNWHEDWPQTSSEPCWHHVGQKQCPAAPSLTSAESWTKERLFQATEFGGCWLSSNNSWQN